jgi:hypothetical protein
VIASFGPNNVFTFDLARHNIVATISEEVAGDRAFWDRTLLPIAVGVLGPALGVVPVHCACLVIDNAGLLIAGESGAGKSTLSVALAQSGFDFISDDWTYLSLNGRKLIAHGLSIPAKLLPDAIQHFPLLAQYTLSPALNQELAYELPAQNVGAQVLSSCEPRWFLFLERVAAEQCRLDPISVDEARHYIDTSVERLPSELQEMCDRRSSIIAHVPRLSCWKLRYGGPPAVAVRGLQGFRMMQRQEILA